MQPVANVVQEPDASRPDSLGDAMTIGQATLAARHSRAGGHPLPVARCLECAQTAPLWTLRRPAIGKRADYGASGSLVARGEHVHGHVAMLNPNPFQNTPCLQPLQHGIRCNPLVGVCETPPMLISGDRSRLVAISSPSVAMWTAHRRTTSTSRSKGDEPVML